MLDIGNNTIISFFLSLTLVCDRTENNNCEKRPQSRNPPSIYFLPVGNIFPWGGEEMVGVDKTVGTIKGEGGGGGNLKKKIKRRGG